MERARFITHRGQRILFLDFSELQETDEILSTIEQAKVLIVQEPKGSVLALTHVQNAKSHAEVTQALKDLAAHNKPYVLASAVVGMSPVYRMVLEAVRLFAKRDIRACDSLVAGKDWLVQQVYAQKSAEQPVG
ncbi:MAG: hypothetical protein M3409_02640 [Gemmatimonadota bacterium]|nr:hypothetical protein [Gemmatimonadota bacterium]